MKSSYKKSSNCKLLLILFFLPIYALAQPGFDDTTVDVPIDGGLSILIAAGVGYSVRELRKRKAN